MFLTMTLIVLIMEHGDTSLDEINRKIVPYKTKSLKIFNCLWKFFFILSIQGISYNLTYNNPLQVVMEEEGEDTVVDVADGVDVMTAMVAMEVDVEVVDMAVEAVVDMEVAITDATKVAITIETIINRWGVGLCNSM